MEEVRQYIAETITTMIEKNDVVIFSASYCSYCDQVKELFKTLDIEPFVYEIDEQAYTQTIRDELYRKTKQRTIPNVFIYGLHMGGLEDIKKMLQNGTLQQYLSGKFKKFQYDLIVIGGGSAGISAAKEAAKLGKTVALFDYVIPSPHGTSWGVGGTCLNVGCVPKKLMHIASIIGTTVCDSKFFGYKVNSSRMKNHSWPIMAKSIQNHIRKSNFELLKYFKKNKIHYHNAYAVFKDIHTITATGRKGKTSEYTAYRFLLACGTRPHIPDFPGNNYAITSDDLFWLTTRPGKTLVIGGSYIALECAGFLIGFGIDCTVLVRDKCLRGFDQQISNVIVSHMQSLGVTFIKGFLPLEITAGPWDDVDPELKYKVKIGKTDGSQEKEEYFNMVLLATGRDSHVEGMGLPSLGITVKPKGRIETDDNDLSSCHTVYVAGDIQSGHDALAPIAIKSGQLIVQRLFANGPQMNYQLVPTTIFTPLEYGCCGYAEKDAKKRYKNDIVCYQKTFVPPEWELSNRNSNRCYCKLVCMKSSKKKVIGVHIVGPNAGEITQGFALAIKLNATLSDFEKLVAVHPSSAEAFTMITNKE